MNRLFLTVIWLSALAVTAAKLAWNPYALASGYTVTASNDFEVESFDAWTNTSLNVPLQPGVQYFLSIEAYDTNGNDIQSGGQPLTMTAPMLPVLPMTNIVWTIHYLSSSNLPAMWIEFAHSTVTNPPLNLFATSNSLSRQ